MFYQLCVHYIRIGADEWILHNHVTTEEKPVTWKVHAMQQGGKLYIQPSHSSSFNAICTSLKSKTQRHLQNELEVNAQHDLNTSQNWLINMLIQGDYIVRDNAEGSFFF